MYDIFFIGKNKDLWKTIKSSYSTAKLANNMADAVKKSFTRFFWVVPGDIILNNSFDFSYEPDDFSQNIIHVFRNGDYFDGISLIPRNKLPTETEFEHRFYVEKKEVDIQASEPKPYDVFDIETYEDYNYALENSSTDMFWSSSPNIKVNQNLIDTFYLSHHNTQDRSQNHAFVHEVDGEKYYNGLFLCSKQQPLTKREVEYRFPVNRREWDLLGSTKKSYDLFEIKTYADYTFALENSTTEMFWMSSPNIKVNVNLINSFYFTHDNEYDRSQNHAFVHEVDGEKYYNGLFLCSKQQPLTKREVEYRFPVNRKEWDLLGSEKIKYPKVSINTYAEYEKACETVSSELFWAIPDDVDVVDAFDFDWYFTHDNQYDRNINHSLLNGKYNDGIILCSKNAKISKKEFDYGFVINKKEHDILASTPRPFDIVFISYNEPNADENFEKLKQSYPYVKRVHGVKGIHNAHIEAARQVDTDMFWVVDADAEIVDGFNFDYQVPRWDRDAVHVWRSRNPINDLVYGYGGVKLLPTGLTLDMDFNKPDMTTSISTKFNAVEEISNITCFNTDAFSAWKSAFRECAKLSSRIIDNQDDLETMERLAIWCNVGTNEPYGIDAIRGAKAGKKFGEENKNNIEELKKINDFDWLKAQFNEKS